MLLAYRSQYLVQYAKERRTSRGYIKVVAVEKQLSLLVPHRTTGDLHAKDHQPVDSKTLLSRATSFSRYAVSRSDSPSGVSAW